MFGVSGPVKALAITDETAGGVVVARPKARRPSSAHAAVSTAVRSAPVQGLGLRRVEVLLDAGDDAVAAVDPQDGRHLEGRCRPAPCRAARAAGGSRRAAPRAGSPRSAGPARGGSSTRALSGWGRGLCSTLIEVVPHLHVGGVQRGDGGGVARLDGGEEAVGEVEGVVWRHARQSGRSYAATHMDRIVVGVDGSEVSRRALAWAIDEARRGATPTVEVGALVGAAGARRQPGRRGATGPDRRDASTTPPTELHRPTPSPTSTRPGVTVRDRSWWRVRPASTLCEQVGRRRRCWWWRRPATARCSTH